MSYLSNSVDTVVTGHGKGQREERGNVTESSRYQCCGILVLFTKKTPNFTERQPSASASISLGPNPSLTGWRQSERSWNPWQEKLWESNLRAKPPFFPQTASVRSTTTNLALSNYLAKVISRVRNSFGISFCFARVWHWVNVIAFNFWRSRGRRRSRPGGV